MLLIGLTGGIASGKSTVSRLLRDHGTYILDADVIARDVLAPGTDGLAAVVDAFGPTILAGDALDREALGRIVFADDESRQTLNNITHRSVGIGHCHSADYGLVLSTLQ